MPLIPVYLWDAPSDLVVPDLLAAINWIDFRKDFLPPLAKLIRAVRKALHKPQVLSGVRVSLLQPDLNSAIVLSSILAVIERNGQVRTASTNNGWIQSALNELLLYDLGPVL